MNCKRSVSKDVNSSRHRGVVEFYRIEKALTSFESELELSESELESEPELDRATRLCAASIC